jgi:hypothetical protein
LAPHCGGWVHSDERIGRAMNETSPNIMRLCETWREQLCRARQLDQVPYAEKLLNLLGWEQPIPFSPRDEAEALSASPYVLRAGGQTALLAFFVFPGTLEPPSTVVEAGLDFCRATRLLLDEAASAHVNYILVSDLQRSYLYDAESDELILTADTPHEFNVEFLPVLGKASVERSALEEIRRQPRSVAARQLREWSHRWAERMVEESDLSEEVANHALDRLVVVQHLLQHDILRRTKGRLAGRFSSLVRRAMDGSYGGVGEELVKLFHDMWFDWGIDLFQGDAALDAVLGRDALTGPMLREFSLLSRNKFSISMVLESFNYGEPTEKMRVRMVPDQNEDRELYLAQQTVATIDTARIEIDIAEEGYRAVAYWFDKLLYLYDQLDVDFEVSQQQAGPPAEEIDLFAWSDIDSRRPSACGDKMWHACEQGIRIYYSTEHQRRVAGLLLAMHLTSGYSARKSTADRFPSVSAALVKRPKALAPGRVIGGGSLGNFGS